MSYTLKCPKCGEKVGLLTSEVVERVSWVHYEEDDDIELVVYDEEETSCQLIDYRCSDCDFTHPAPVLHEQIVKYFLQQFPECYGEKRSFDII